MKVQNFSPRPEHDHAKVLRLCRFVERCVRPGADCNLKLDSQWKRRSLTVGITQLNPENPQQVDVMIWMSFGASYPRSTMHVPETGKIVLNSWEEEFVLVLAHEARHILHFRHFIDVMTPEEMEIDAEFSALEVLEKFRKNQSRRAPMTQNDSLHAG